jgi:hypothetical protein
MKNENQIWQDVVDSVKAGLEYNEITDFEVRQSSQPSKATINSPTLWVERVSSKRYGCQSRLPVRVGSALVEKIIYYQEAVYQITAMKKRLPTDTVNTQTAGDVLNLLTTYFSSSSGIEKLNEKGFNCLRITEVREPSNIMDSDLYEKTPSFDITLTHIQEDTKVIQKVDEFTATVERV